MGQVDNQKSEESEKEEESEEKEEKREDGRKRLESGGEDHIEFGEQLQDDLINQFCDKLQAVCPSKLEALLAVQAVIISGSQELRKHVSGKENAAQIIYDTTRSHYVLLHFNVKHRHVEIYDSLQPFNAKGEPMLIEEISTQIIDLFGHLFERYIACLVDAEYDRQSDNFSCGYRAIGALVDLARGSKPAEFKYSPKHCLRFLKIVIAEKSPSWEMFSRSKFAYEKDYSGRHRMRFHIDKRAGSSSSSSSVSSLSTASLPSRVSGGSEKLGTCNHGEEVDEEEQCYSIQEKEDEIGGNVFGQFKNLTMGFFGWKKEEE